jgi:hypothetical protein
MKPPDWYIKLVDKTRPALQAFRLVDLNHVYDMPSCFLYMSNGDDWYDWDDGVCVVSQSIMYHGPVMSWLHKMKIVTYFQSGKVK